MKLPAKLRLTVTQWRILILCINFVLAAVVLGRVGYRFIGGGGEHDSGRIRELLKPPPGGFAPPKHPSGQGGGENPTTVVNGISKWFAKKQDSSTLDDAVATTIAEPVMEPGEDDEPVDKLPDGEGVYANGPLSDSHDFLFCIYFGEPHDSRNRAVLKEKEDQPAVSRSRRSNVPTINGGKDRKRRLGRGEKRGVQKTPKLAGKAGRKTNKRHRGRRATPRKKKGARKESVTLKTYQEHKLKEDTDDEFVILVHSISPSEFRYRDENLKLYTLKRKSESLYDQTDDGPALSPKKEEEEEGVEADAEEEEEKHFIVGRAETAQEHYEQVISGRRNLKKKEDPEESETEDDGPNVQGSIEFDRVNAARGRRQVKKPTAADRKKMGAMMKDIEKSDKFKDMSPKEKKDLEKLRKMLGGRK